MCLHKTGQGSSLQVMVTDYNMLTQSLKFTKPILSPLTPNLIGIETFLGHCSWSLLEKIITVYQTGPHIKVDSKKLFTNNEHILKYFYLL